MMVARIVLSVVAMLLSATLAGAADRPSGPAPEATDAVVAQGKEIYFRRCSFCHGLLGDGEGPAAPFLDPPTAATTPTPTATPTATPDSCSSEGTTCKKNSECCSNQCSGARGNKVCQP